MIVGQKLPVLNFAYHVSREVVLYISQSVAVLRRFGLKTGIDFAYFGLESGMVFEGTTRSHHYHFNSK